MGASEVFTKCQKADVKGSLNAARAANKKYSEKPWKLQSGF